MTMNRENLISKFRIAFGDNVPLPVAISYTDRPLGNPPAKKVHCIMQHLITARDGEPISLSAENVLCGGGKVYTGYGDLTDRICNFVSGVEKYKETPQLVADYVDALRLPGREGQYLNFIKIDNPNVDLDSSEGIVIFGNADVVSGLWSWAHFDNNHDDALVAPFGSGCSSTISNMVRENRNNGYRCFIGMLDISVRPMMKSGEMVVSIPRCRLSQMMETIDRSCLSGAPAWKKVKDRIDNEYQTEN